MLIKDKTIYKISNKINFNNNNYLYLYNKNKDHINYIHKVIITYKNKVKQDKVIELKAQINNTMILLQIVQIINN